MHKLKFLTQEDFPYKKLVETIESAFQYINNEEDTWVLNIILDDFK